MERNATRVCVFPFRPAPVKLPTRARQAAVKEKLVQTELVFHPSQGNAVTTRIVKRARHAIRGYAARRCLALGARAPRVVPLRIFAQTEHVSPRWDAVKIQIVRMVRHASLERARPSPLVLRIVNAMPARGAKLARAWPSRGAAKTKTVVKAKPVVMVLASSRVLDVQPILTARHDKFVRAEVVLQIRPVRTPLLVAAATNARQGLASQRSRVPAMSSAARIKSVGKARALRVPRAQKTPIARQKVKNVRPAGLARVSRRKNAFQVPNVVQAISVKRGPVLRRMLVPARGIAMPGTCVKLARVLRRQDAMEILPAEWEKSARRVAASHNQHARLTPAAARIGSVKTEHVFQNHPALARVAAGVATLVKVGFVCPRQAVKGLLSATQVTFAKQVHASRMLAAPRPHTARVEKPVKMALALCRAQDATMMSTVMAATGATRAHANQFQARHVQKLRTARSARHVSQDHA